MVDCGLDACFVQPRRTLPIAFALTLTTAVGALTVEWIPWDAPLMAVSGMAALFVAAVALATRAMGNAYEGRATAVAALSCLGLVPAAASAAFQALSAASAPPMLADAAATMVLAAIGFAAAFTVATRRSDTWLRPAVACVALFTGAIVVATLPETWHAPETLPLVATVPAGDASVDAFDEQRPLPGTGFALGRSCIGHSCFAYVRHDDRVRSIGPRVARDAELTLRHDVAAGTLVMSADAHPIAVIPGDLGDWTWHAPAAWRASPPPQSFVALAAAALAGAGVWLTRRWQLSRRLAALPSLVSGELDAGGWLHLDGVEPPRRLAVHDDPGPVVVLDGFPDGLSGGSSGGGAYRGSQHVDARLYRGDRPSLEESLTRALETADACALGWMALMATPLALATVMRFW